MKVCIKMEKAIIKFVDNIEIKTQKFLQHKRPILISNIAI